MTRIHILAALAALASILMSVGCATTTTEPVPTAGAAAGSVPGTKVQLPLWVDPNQDGDISAREYKAASAAIKKM